MLPRLTLPPSNATLALMALAFALPGLTGHDLWKTHDAIGLGIVYDMATGGNPLVPRIAGMPWLFDPPLYHWLAAGFGSAFQFFAEFHSAARVVSGVLVLASFWLIYVAARDDFPAETAYQIAKVLGDHHDEMVAAFKAANSSTAENTAKYPGFKLHPGTERYLREKGLLK